MEDTAELRRTGRQERLEQAVSRLRSRASGVPVERALVVLGAATIVLGLGVILLGWYGASRTPYLFEQVPYLISGGLLGLGLAFVGGFLYFAYWVTRLVQSSRRESQQLREGLERIESLLAERLSPAARGAHPARGRTASANGTYVATEKGTMFHRPDCSVVAGRSNLRRVSPEAPGMEPCGICDPLGVG